MSTRGAPAGVASGFYTMVTGSIDGCQMTGADNLYVKYSFNKGHDWTVLAGVEHGVSQISKRSSGAASDVLVWNYPLDIMFRSSNVHGWPQIVIGVYGLTLWGADVIRGYGCTHVPTIPGRHTKYIQLYTPISSSFCQRLTAWVTNNPPEFFDSKFIAQGKGREVTRVRSHGCVKVTFNVTTKNMTEWGYQVSAERAGDMLTAEAALSAGVNAAMATSAAVATDDERAGGSAAAPRAASRLARKPPASTSSYTAAGASTAATAAPSSSGISAALLNPPSGASSRENSLIRRQPPSGAAAAAARVTNDPFDSSLDEEAKYPQRPSRTASATGAIEMQQTTPAAGSLAPLRTGPRQLF